MRNLPIFAKGLIPTNDIYPMLKNCVLKDNEFICSNDFISLYYIMQDNKINGCFDTKTILNTIANLNFNSPYTVQNNEGNTSILQGNFSLNLSKIPVENYPISKPIEYTQELFYPQLIEIFKNISLYIGIDASRAWCMGIHIKDNKIYTTNNTVCAGVLSELKMNDRFIPAQLIEKILALHTQGYIPEYWIDNDIMTGVKYKEGHIYFCKRSAEPMDLSKPLIKEEQVEWTTVSPITVDNIKKVVSFTDEIYIDFDGDIIQTHRDKEYGAKIKNDISFGIGGAFVHKYFIPLCEFNTKFAFYNDRVMFYKKLENIEYYFVEAKYVI